MREMPSSRLIAIKRSFFDPKVARESLGGGVEALKGVYQSIRAAQVCTPIHDADHDLMSSGRSSCCQRRRIQFNFLGKLVLACDCYSADWGPFVPRAWRQDQKEAERL